MAWFDSNWLNRKKITVDNTKVDADINDFPILIDVTDVDFKDARTDGFDFVITKTDGTTERPYDREKWDDATGKLVLWFKGDVKDATDVDFYIYYNNSGQSTDKADPANVWDANYNAVLHLHDDFDDSTSNNNDFVNSGSVDAAAKIADGQDFDATDDEIEDADGESYINGLSAFTISMWIKSNVTNVDKGFFSGKASDGNDGITVRYDKAGFSGGGTDLIKYALVITGGLSAGESASNVQTTNDQYIVMTWASGGAVKLYIDGVETTPTSTPASRSGTITGAIFAKIGRAQKNGDPFWDGLMDEVRFSDVARSADQIKTEHNNQDSPSTFVSFGAEESEATQVGRTFNVRHDLAEFIGRTFNIRHDLAEFVNRTFTVRHDILILVNRTFNIRHDVLILVNRTFNIRHDISQFVNRTFNIRHDIAEFVNRTFNLRHDILILVNRTFNLRHDLAGLVNRTFNIRHDLAQFVSRTFNIRHDIAQFVTRTFNIRHDILVLVNRTFNLRHDVLILVGRTFNIRHDLAQFVGRTFNLRHDISQFVNRTFNIRHDILILVNRTFNIRHDIAQLINRTFNIRHDILVLVNRTFNLRHDVLILVNRTFNVRHDLAELVSRTFNLRHDVAGTVGRTFNIRHDIAQFVARTFNIRHDILNLVSRTFNIRHDIQTLIARTFNIRHDLIQLTGRTFNLRHDILTVVPTIPSRRPKPIIRKKFLQVERTEERISIWFVFMLVLPEETTRQRLETLIPVKMYQRESIDGLIILPELWKSKDHIKSELSVILKQKRKLYARFTTKLGKKQSTGNYINWMMMNHERYTIVMGRRGIDPEDLITLLASD